MRASVGFVRGSSFLSSFFVSFSAMEKERRKKHKYICLWLVFLSSKLKKYCWF
jgi:hypothetical protein